MQISPTVRTALLSVLFVLVVFHCFFTGLARTGFVGPDEPRYASIAREMARSGDWVTPRLNGSPWFEKPPLYYWSAALGFLLFSTPEVAARVPSGMFALLTVLGLALVARRLYGPSATFAVAIMLPATVAMTGFARAAATDMPFAACLTLAMAAAAFLLLPEQPSQIGLIAAAFGAALGLAVLAKGPAAIVLAGGGAGLWAVVSGNLRRVWRLFHPLAIVVFAAAALPWYVLCALRNPTFLRVFLLQHNVERFLTNRYQHQQPFWFFVPVLLVAAFPWTLLLAPALAGAWRALRGAEWRKSSEVFFAAWVVFPFVFFSASQSKLPGYILPAVPPVILLLARNLAVSSPASRFHLMWVSATLAAVGCMPFLPQFYAPRGQEARTLLAAPGVEGPLALLGAALLLAAVLVAVAGWMRRVDTGIAIAALLFSFAVGITANHVLPRWDSSISARQFAHSAHEQAAGASLAVYKLPRAWQFGAEFYLDLALPEWTPAIPHPVCVMTSVRSLPDLERLSASGRFVATPSGPATLYCLP